MSSIVPPIVPQERTYNPYTDNDARQVDTSDALVEFNQGYRLEHNYTHVSLEHGGLVKNPLFGTSPTEPEFILPQEGWVRDSDAPTRKDLPHEIWRLILLWVFKLNPTNMAANYQVARTCRGFRAAILAYNIDQNPQYRLKVLSKIFLLTLTPLKIVSLIPDKTINPESLNQPQPPSLEISPLFSDQNGRSIHLLNKTHLLFTDLSTNFNAMMEFSDKEIEILNLINFDPSLPPARLILQTLDALGEWYYYNGYYIMKNADMKNADLPALIGKGTEALGHLPAYLEREAYSNQFNPTYKVNIRDLLTELKQKFTFIDTTAQSFVVHAQLLSKTTFALSINSYLVIGRFDEKHIPIFEDCFDYTNTPIRSMTAMPDQTLMLNAGNDLIQLSVSNHATHMLHQFKNHIFSFMTPTNGALFGLDLQGNTHKLYLDTMEGNPLNSLNSSLYPQKWLVGHTWDSKLQILNLEDENASWQVLGGLGGTLGNLNESVARSYQLFGDLLFVNYKDDLTVVHLPTRKVLKQGPLIDLFMTQLPEHNIYSISSELVGTKIFMRVLSLSPKNELTYSRISTAYDLISNITTFTTLDRPQEAATARNKYTKEIKAKIDEVHQKQIKTPLIPAKPILPAPLSQAHKIALIFGSVLLALTALNVASFMVLQTGVVCFTAGGIIVTLPAAIAFAAGVPFSLGLIALGSVLWWKNNKAKQLTA